MSFPLTVEQISDVLGEWFVGPNLSAGYTRQMQGIMRANVAANWPELETALAAREIDSPLVCVAAIATVAIETNTFAPIRERGGPSYLADLYEGRADLGNTQVGDGVRFRGRGFVQITGRWSYDHFGKEIHRDLVNDPDLALNVGVASEIFAAFFIERHVPEYAEKENWVMVRRRVNGGQNGLDRFVTAATKLAALAGAHRPATGRVTLAAHAEQGREGA